MGLSPSLGPFCSASLTFFSMLFVALSLGTAGAQDFRVYTTIQDMAAARSSRSDKADHPVIGRSRTLFHAGRIYDYIEAIDEVIVIDFNSERRHYRLLNPSRELTATIYFDELRKKLQDALSFADDGIRKMEATNQPRYREAIALHRFQRAPRFVETFNDSDRQLRLSSSLIQYRVKCAPPPLAAYAEAYCRYADAICQLNYVLHPGLLTPEPRLKLDEALLKRGLIPTEVELDVNQSQRISLLATHQFRWQLDQSDRQNIDYWESLLTTLAPRQVSIQDYQNEVVRAAARSKK